MNTARDNYYKECPAVMNYATFTDYRSPSSREEYIRNINNKFKQEFGDIE